MSLNWHKSSVSVNLERYELIKREAVNHVWSKLKKLGITPQAHDDSYAVKFALEQLGEESEGFEKDIIVLTSLYQDGCFEKETKEEVYFERAEPKFKPKSYYQSFYQTEEWELLKTRVKRIYNPNKCMKCKCWTKNIHVDHIKPRSLYRHLELDINNLQILCAPCNNKKSNKNEDDYRPRWVAGKDFNIQKHYDDAVCYRRNKSRKKPNYQQHKNKQP